MADRVPTFIRIQKHCTKSATAQDLSAASEPGKLWLQAGRLPHGLQEMPTGRRDHLIESTSDCCGTVCVQSSLRLAHEGVRYVRTSTCTEGCGFCEGIVPTSAPCLFMKMQRTSAPTKSFRGMHVWMCRHMRGPRLTNSVVSLDEEPRASRKNGIGGNGAMGPRDDHASQLPDAPGVADCNGAQQRLPSYLRRPPLSCLVSGLQCNLRTLNARPYKVLRLTTVHYP